MKMFRYHIEYLEPLDVISAYHDEPYSLFFDGASPDHTLNRYSFVAFNPVEMIEYNNHSIRIINDSGESFYPHAAPFSVIRERMEYHNCNEYNAPSRDPLPPFQGGAAGFWGYDLARTLEVVPEISEDDPDIPDMAIGIYHTVYAWDHKRNKGWLFVCAKDDDSAADIHHKFLNTVENSQPYSSCPPTEKVNWQVTHTQKQYETTVQNVIDYIYAGDIFQANISQRFETELPKDFDHFGHYLYLRNINPAPFSSYMNFGKFKLASASPERFLYVHDRNVETKPIKGTAPRRKDMEDDVRAAKALANNEKELAENTMIVDLMRNDLSKVCADYSVEVPKLCKVESFVNIHHLVSTVTGTLRGDKDAIHLLEACFPGGSITGAPKIRAMEIIEELEPKRRGPYCGALGYIGFDGNMDTNITIRTIVYNGEQANFNVGGGITADSVPRMEYEETMAKAEALFQSFENSEYQKARMS